ncbi:MAG: glycosyltransferase 87 family protein [Flavobacteriales bacterium]|jgi:hypothetical protein|nr:glycosyltransferase 87 family protein [Flavobacteriales bacterium]
MKYKIIFGLLFIFGLFLLANFKLIWFDEVYFAEITYHLMNGHGLYSQGDFLSTQGAEIVTYGPIYFYLTSFITQIGELSPFWFRLTNYLAFFGVVLVLFNQIRKHHSRKKMLYLIPFALFLGNAGFENAVSGRMEALGLLFSVIAYVLYSKNTKTLLHYILIGLCISCAYLTTPRTAILFIPFFFVILKDLFVHKNWKEVINLGFWFGIPVLAWIFFKFGGFEEYLNYYTKNTNHNTQSASMAGEFLFNGIHLSKNKIVLFSLMFISFLIPKKQTKQEKFLTINFGIISTLFLLIISDHGGHFGLVSTLIIFTIISNAMASKWKIGHLMLPAILFLNLFMFSSKFAYHILNTNRSHKPIQSMVEKHIPEGAVTVADFEFFYALREKKRDMYFFQLGKFAKERVEYFCKNTDPEYVLTSNTDPKLEYFKSHYDIETIAKYPKKQNEHQLFIDQYLRKLGSSYMTSDYSELAIFKLKRK